MVDMDINNLSPDEARGIAADEGINHCANCDIAIPADGLWCMPCAMRAVDYGKRLTALSAAIDEEIDYARKSRAQQSYTALRLEACAEIAGFDEASE